ncbi:hypothetical protein SG26_20440 (plasmid) [Haloarcula sp. CBA1115]|uniref:hypothetical protein n=1 Tax=Haloarcula sp. CBA1115 TaxID=1592728 RepID=UPI0005955265|nr:hypothetical protein [Haloarcula sp. CBA1115]AJF28119.1 hypothetical protein SG26_20440 [Haloarcula sp. CBA1115]
MGLFRFLNQWREKKDGTLEGPALSTKNYYTVQGDTLEDIDQAISDHQYIKLDPTTTYSGDTTITIDPKGPRDICIAAYGAEIEYTGSGVAVDILPNEGAGSDDRVEWRGGYIRGPGPSTTGSRGIRLVDAFRHKITPSVVEGFEYGVYLKNEDLYTEDNDIVIKRIKDCKSGIRLEGATFTGGTGTDSFKSLKFHSSIAQCEIGFDMRDAYIMANARLDFVTFVNTGKIGWRVDGSLRGAEVVANFDSAGSDGGVGVRLISLDKHAGHTICTFAGVNTEFEDPNSTPFIHSRAEVGDVVYDRNTKLYEQTADSYYGTRKMQRDRYRIGSVDERTDYLQFQDADGTNRAYFAKNQFNHPALFISESGQRFEVWNEADNENANIRGGDIQARGGKVEFGSNGAHIYINGSGELVAVDDDGNETTIS